MFVEGVPLVRVQIIHHHPDAVRIRLVIIHQRLHLNDEFLFAPSLRYFNVSPASQRFDYHEKVACAIPFISIVIPSDRSRAGRERVADFFVQFLVGLIKTDDWTLFVVGFVVEIKNVPHLADEGSAVLGRNYPRFGSVMV
nr:hypothetical protein [Haloarcula sp. 1CSR25-25]